jgi:N6-adenosine-specific RNA methylase IME4
MACSPDAFQVIDSWGFTFRTHCVWIKPSIGPGQWVRNRHELLLIANRGSFAPPEPEDRIDSVIEAPRGRHSEKPECLYELIERMYPHASKLELFARRRRPGWAAWGNEVPA